MKPARLIPTLQSDALAREIEQQLKEETAAVIADAQRDAQALVAQARAAARTQVHTAIVELRREGERRRARAQAQRDTETRQRAQQRAARAVEDALPLLRKMLAERWRDEPARRQWSAAIAQACDRRLRPGAWIVEHPRDWSGTEQRDFVTAIGADKGAEISFKPVNELAAGLRVTCDQAVLDATPQGLLAERHIIAALLLDEIGAPP